MLGYFSSLKIRNRELRIGSKIHVQVCPTCFKCQPGSSPNIPYITFYPSLPSWVGHKSQSVLLLLRGSFLKSCRRDVTPLFSLPESLHALIPAAIDEISNEYSMNSVGLRGFLVSLCD